MVAGGEGRRWSHGWAGCSSGTHRAARQGLLGCGSPQQFTPCLSHIQRQQQGCQQSRRTASAHLESVKVFSRARRRRRICVRQLDAVASCQLHHEPWLQRALHMQVQLRLGQPSDERLQAALLLGGVVQGLQGWGVGERRRAASGRRWPRRWPLQGMAGMPALTCMRG